MPMTYARAHLVDTENGGFYHCISRCVRRGWLCGLDAVSGRSFEHRRAWVESRLLMLTEVFCVEVYGYAVMSNHYHVVINVDPKGVNEWSDEEVTRRWLRLSPAKGDDGAERKAQALLADDERLGEIRTRLGSLSWFMRYLNEPIARWANREDRCTGRFWEGRFKSIALLDEAAILACMAYVDLNPIRAKMTTRIEAAPYTSVKRRVDHAAQDPAPLAPLEPLGLRLPDYVALLEWTAAIDGGGVARPEGSAANALGRLDRTPEDWLAQVKAQRFKYRAYGAVSLLKRYAQSLGQRWIKCSTRSMLAAT